jgi:phage/plasmid primase-like uncharacterized protein
MTSADFDAWVSRAGSVLLEDEIARRGIQLKRIGHELIGGCPVCGGKDRFAISLTKHLWNCRGCNQGGDILDFVQHLDGCGFSAAVEALAGALPAGHQKPRALARNGGIISLNSFISYPTKISKWWNEAKPVEGTLAQRLYLASRGIHKLPPDAGEVLRFHSHCVFGRDGDEWRFLPCLIALVRDVITNAPKAVIRTALTPDGKKIARMAFGPTAGGAVKLWGDEWVSTGLVVGEGVETVLAAAQRSYLGTLLQPAWAVIDAGHLVRFPVLAGIEALTILTDNDEPGQRAARECADRWVAAGREVDVLIPNAIGADFNDITMEA